MNNLTEVQQQQLVEIINKPICGDCIEVMKKIPDRIISCVWTDPPYGKDYIYDKYDDSKPETAYWDMLDRVFDEIERITAYNSSIYVKQDMDNIFLMMKILNRFATFKNLIIWKAPSQSQQHDNYGKAYEIILYYIRGEPTFNEYAERRRSRDDVPSDSELRKKEFRGKMDNLWDDVKRIVAGALISKEAILEAGTKKKIHSCQSPEGIIRRSLLFSTNEGDLVLDPFGGVFSTMAVCKKLKRNCISCDISEKYVQAGIERLAIIDEQMKQGVLLDTPEAKQEIKKEEARLF